MKTKLRELINILALPNMGDEGRKQKLIAIKAWQIKFLNELEAIRKAVKECDSARGYEYGQLKILDEILEV